jgi:hypothetical protein
MVVGVGNSLEDIIGRHPSVQRHVRGISIPFMTESEIADLIERGENDCGYRFEPQARDFAIRVSSGVPYLAQLFCLHATRVAATRGEGHTISSEDVEEARKSLLVELDPIVLDQYVAVTKGGRNTFTADVLYAASSCAFDEHGAFSAKDVAAELRGLREKEISALAVNSTLSRLAKGSPEQILQTLGTPGGNRRYTFANPAMRQCVLLRQGIRGQALPSER